MILKNLSSAPKIPFNTQGAASVEMQVLLGPDDGCPNFVMRHFTVAPGGRTPHHFHDFEHEILVLQGAGQATAAGSEQPIKTGDVLYIPANEPHQFKNTGNVPLHFICLVPAFVHKPGAPMPTPVDCSMDAPTT